MRICAAAAGVQYRTLPPERAGELQELITSALDDAASGERAQLVEAEREDPEQRAEQDVAAAEELLAGGVGLKSKSKGKGPDLI